MPKRLTQLLCMLLLAAVPFVLLPKASASLSYRDVNAPECFVNAYTINVYEKPSTKSSVREVVPFARNIKCLAVKKGWARVYTVNRVLGYCKTDHLSSRDLNTLNMTVYCQQGEIDVYRFPSVTSSVMGHFYRNDALHLVAMTPLGDWLRVEQNGYYGYVQRPRTDNRKYAKGRPAWCIDNAMTVYYDYRKDTPLYTMFFGQSFTLLEKRGSWAKIRSNSDLIGYCKVSAISTTNPNNINIPVYTQVDGNFMFKSSTDLSGRVQVDKNEPMLLLALDTSRFWARVRYGEDYYYMPYVFLGTERLGDAYKKVVCTAGVNVRSGTKHSSNIEGTVPTGTEMWLIDATDNRAKVKTLPDYNGRSYTGYVELQYLR